MPYFLHDNVNLYYEVHGSGDVVLLIHGFLESSNMWDDVVPTLSKNKQVLCLDLPGFGKSDCERKIHTMSFFSTCIDALLIELKINDCTLIGHSMGGYVALAALNVCPEKINHICLFHSTAMSDSEDRKKNRERAVASIEYKKSVYLKTSIPFLFQEIFLKRGAMKIDKMVAEANEFSETAIIAALKGMAQRRDTNRVLKMFSGKKTYIFGAEDPVLSSLSLKQEALENDATFIEIKDAGHMSHLEAPEKALEAIKKATS